MSEPLFFRGGRVVDPSRELDATLDLAVSHGVIAAVGEGLDAPEGAREIDASGLVITPGLIDVHVHLREPGQEEKETIATGAAAAVNGGFTTVCCMPNTSPPLDRPELIRLVLDRAAEAGGARVLPIGCATLGRAGSEPADITALTRAGAAGFSDDGDCVASAGVMLEVLRRVRAAGSCFMQHCQDPTLTPGAVMNAGALAERLGLPGWPAVAEEIIIERDVRLNRVAGCRYHAQHVSSGESAAIIRRARAEGLPVTGEVSPHHLLLTEDACADLDPNAKMNPPLRSARDVTLLKEAVADGSITVLATDHAPHPAAAKSVPFTDAAFGVVGLDCALPLYARALVADGVIGWPRLLAMMTIEPARLIGADAAGYGTLAIGGPADVTLIDPDLAWTIEPAAFASAGRNCPFAGWRVRGRAVMTIVEGEVSLLRSEERAGA